MNVSDTQIVRQILRQSGRFREVGENTSSLGSLKSDGTSNGNNEDSDASGVADVWLTNTCAIRENAEQKIWTRLQTQRAMKRKIKLQTKKRNRSHGASQPFSEKAIVVGVLGCMAERLKQDLLQNSIADVVVGPDAYRELPKLLLNVLEQEQTSAVDVTLSKTETYADIIPFHEENLHSAFVSIQRGCSNRCSFCIVPFTRGIERSRPMESIMDEVRYLVHDLGVKEITLLGQNVNSYHDQSRDSNNQNTIPLSSSYVLSNAGFRSRIHRPDTGYFFADLLSAVSLEFPTTRIRFTSPHPKDYPKHLLELMAERPNICNHLHMPAQSGSTNALQRMKRGYTREAYLQLIDDVRSCIPDVAISSDFIAGFCNETEEDHAETLSLLEVVQYDQAFLFAYSRREQTYAARVLDDTVPADVKQRRLQELIDTFHTTVHQKNVRHEVGQLRLVLVEGESRRSTPTQRQWHGRTDQNKRIRFDIQDESDHVPGTDDGEDEEDGIRCWNDDDMRSILMGESPATLYPTSFLETPKRSILKRGDYAVLLVTEARGHTLRGKLLWKTDGILQFEQSGLSGTMDSVMQQVRQERIRRIRKLFSGCPDDTSTVTSESSHISSFSEDVTTTAIM
jgi:MiaB/RimO family radical SAM methylthiotransferase